MRSECYCTHMIDDGEIWAQIPARSCVRKLSGQKYLQLFDIIMEGTSLYLIL